MAHTHDHDGDEGGACQHPTPEQDYAIASEAFQQGDLPHAAFHVTGALAENPMHPEWRALFDRIIEAAPAPEELISIEDGAYFGHVAGHAYILAHGGQLERAFDLLCQVMRVCPDRGYHLWAVEWLRRCHGKPVDLHPFLGVFADLIQPTIGRLRLRPAERFALAGAVALVRELVKTESGRRCSWPSPAASSAAGRSPTRRSASPAARWRSSRRPPGPSRSGWGAVWWIRPRRWRRFTARSPWTPTRSTRWSWRGRCGRRASWSWRCPT